MGSFAAYSLQTAIFLLAGYLIYKWLMASEKQIAFNRWAIIGIYVISFAARPIADLIRNQVSATDTGIGLGKLSMTAIVANDTEAEIWPLVLVMVYITGMIVVALWSLIVMFRLSAIIRSGHHIVCSGYTLVILPNHSVAPFSWGRYIVMSRDDYDSAGDMIIAHELAHIGHRHCLDLLVAQLVCVLQWFNPAAWLLREELKSVHEFQADDSVISQGVDARQYQLLLIKKAVGIRFHSIANSLNHSNLKKRITMMYNQKTSGSRRLRGLALLPALAVALAVTNIPAVASVLSRTEAAKIVATAEITPKVTEKDKSTQASTEQIQVDKLAQFAGGQGNMFKFLMENIKFPPELIESGLSGKVVIHFTVKPDGSLADFEVAKSLSPEADAEALRVVKAMPAWEPAILDGKPVASSYALPISFKQVPDKTEKPVGSSNENTSAK